MSRETRQLLEKVMQGAILTPAEIDNLLTGRVPEDLHLDYKHGHELNDAAKGRQTVREYVSAFANSDGGILLIGVDEANWQVTGATAPGGDPLDRWASGCFVGTASHFSPLPRFHTVSHPGGNVLVAAAARSASLVPVVKDGRLTYFLRLHDKTLRADEWLMSDLVLGRRQHPFVVIRAVKVAEEERTTDPQDFYTLSIRFRFVLENESLIWSEQTDLGLIACEVGSPADSSVSPNLLSYLEVRAPAGNPGALVGRLTHEHIQVTTALKPFVYQGCSPDHLFRIPLRHLGQQYIPATWKAALYINSKGSPPVWYQLSLAVNEQLLTALKEGGRGRVNANIDQHLEFERLDGARPVVAYEPDRP